MRNISALGLLAMISCASTGVKQKQDLLVVDRYVQVINHCGSSCVVDSKYVVQNEEFTILDQVTLCDMNRDSKVDSVEVYGTNPTLPEHVSITGKHERKEKTLDEKTWAALDELYTFRMEHNYSPDLLECETH